MKTKPEINSEKKVSTLVFIIEFCLEFIRNDNSFSYLKLKFLVQANKNIDNNNKQQLEIKLRAAPDSVVVSGDPVVGPAVEPEEDVVASEGAVGPVEPEEEVVDVIGMVVGVAVEGVMEGEAVEGEAVEGVEGVESEGDMPGVVDPVEVEISGVWLETEVGVVPVGGGVGETDEHASGLVPY